MRRTVLRRRRHHSLDGDPGTEAKGVEVVFACGGGIYTSAAEAAAKVDGKVIGVDSDQSGIIGEDITVTSAVGRVLHRL